MSTGYTPEQLENVGKQAYHLAMSVGKLVGEDPTLMVACLTMAACQAAVLSEVSYEDLETLFKLHYQTSLAGKTAVEAEGAGGLGKLPGGNQ